MHRFQKKLLHWFADHGRDLPWRQTYDPYHIWISEIMLQQTQMDRAASYFIRFIKRYPDIKTLAAANEDEVLKLWEGLGYYSRAGNSVKTARILVKSYNGNLPKDYEALLTLPGIGPYTAGAIMSLAFNCNCPVVDANIMRVFARLYDISTPISNTATRNFIRQTALELIPPGKARFFNQALMELGALICLPRTPNCPVCPIADSCLSLQRNVTNQRPVKKPGKGVIPIIMACALLIHQGRLFIQKRPKTGVWANLWEFPGGRLEPGETPEEAVVREFFEETEFRITLEKKITTTRHSYMHFRVTLHCFVCSMEGKGTEPVCHDAQEWKWVTWEELADYAFPAGHRKLIAYLSAQPSMTASFLAWI